MTNDTRLGEIRARADAATEGPWTAEYSGEQGNCVLPPGYQSTREAVAVTRLLSAQADAELIANARTDLPALLAAVEAVMKRHRPVEVEPSETICAECSTLRGQGETARYFPFTEYPCPTVRAITDALDADTTTREDQS